MSMPSWLNDVQPLPNADATGFASSTDPNNAFMQMAPGGVSFDYNLLQNSQYPPQMANGSARNGSPAFSNNMYQTQQVIPSKRSHPREGSIGASPRQKPGGLPATRSQTPQQGPYPGFQPNLNGGQQLQAHTPYQRYNNAGSSASLSPPMPTQQFNPPNMPPRVQTISPSPFSPATQNFGPQASPSHSEHGSRVNTPQNGGQTYVQGMPYGTGTNQPFTPPASAVNMGSQPPSTLQQQQQRMHELRQRQYIQQMQATNAAMQSQYQAGRPNQPGNPPAQMMAMQAGPRMHPPQQPMGRPHSTEQFVRSVSAFMQQKALPFNPHPTAAGRPVNVYQLFTAVMRLSGSKSTSARGLWPSVAQSLQIPPAQQMVAAQDLQNYWQANLRQYEFHQLQQLQQRQVQMSRPTQPAGSALSQDPFSPMKQKNAQLYEQNVPATIHTRGPTQADFQNSDKRLFPQQHDEGGQANGTSTSHQTSADGRYSSLQVVPQNRAQYPLQRSSSPQSQQIVPTPEVVRAKGNRIKPDMTTIALNSKPRKPAEPLSPTFIPLVDKIGEERHGGLSIRSLQGLGERITNYKPKLPKLSEMGTIDIRALTMSLRSGIHGEVRLALETFLILSFSPGIALEDCEDLVDVLIECAEEQVELLAENAPEVSDAMLINSYEDMVRGSKIENSSLQEAPEFGTLEYDLDRAVDKLICISTILRNLSVLEFNHRPLAEPVVIRFLTMVMRYLGTRNMLLRSHNNTLEFTKDVVIYLTNLSQQIDLPGKEEALCILHFLLSFAPCPPPFGVGEEVIFPSYNPALQPYLPHAIDSFTKLLAKDEPNRTFYRSIFNVDGGPFSPFDLLTRTFGFAIAPLPEHLTEYLPKHRIEELFAIVQARGPYLAQGLLTAELLIGLIPPAEHTLAYTWLSSQDGFAPRLLKIVTLLGGRPQPRSPHNPQISEIESMYNMITHRGLAVLKKLAEKVKGSDRPIDGLLQDIFPKKESVLETLLQPRMDRSLLRQLCAYAGMAC
ncbi:MAG: hypothetical protein LQ342_001347 [Letrouitia transgressa]|nr:MAG: hypothetical protein LQ342_001347 [Letrouitia transgressa]